MKTVFSLAFLLLHFSCLSQNSHSLLDQNISELINKNIESNNIPGAVILVKKCSKVLYRKAFGYAKLHEFDGSRSKYPEKMTTEHSFDIASLTKVVGTTTAVMKLFDSGKLKIDDPVFNYIKNFDQGDKKQITLRHLLTHTAGLYEWYPLYYFSNNRKDTYEFIKNLPLKYKVGEGRHYSDLGFTLLGEIIESVSGLPLNDYLQKEVFTPLKMKNTAYNPVNVKNKFAATSWGNPFEKRMIEDPSLGFTIQGLDPKSWSEWRKYVLAGQVNDGNAWYANQGISGAAGLFSTVDDLQKLVDMLLNNGKSGKKVFLKSETVKAFTSIDSNKNGLGWMMDPNNAFIKNAPQGSFGHTGFTGTSIAVVPEKKLSVIILINRQNMGLIELKEYFNVNPIRQEIFETIMKSY